MKTTDTTNQASGKSESEISRGSDAWGTAALALLLVLFLLAVMATAHSVVVTF